ncbi:uncharacterized protein N0V89_007549 [Didymosphaeria variabile]|uniref:Uncharacterized protein n=1 Tax=Didymosphaeria variabile TaxID=1932322 RepID=A0A9W8XJT8_9PLEO|nr:uncharacterized protein N0V89_007549 [Didymosphaeria variabile]KAJ4352202.1 hypothetical protein N0V89_007549 [Didymosphaeria variabile]
MGGHVIGVYMTSVEDDNSFDVPRDLRFCILPHNDARANRFYAVAPSTRKSVAPIFTRGLAQGICRQIRAESLNYQFKMNIFHVDGPLDLIFLYRSLSMTKLQAIQQISIEMQYLNEAGIDQTSSSSLRDTFPNLKRVFYAGTASRYQSDMSALLKAMGLGNQFSGIELVMMDALDRNTVIQDAQIYNL